MAVYRVERTRDYTVMSNHHLKDTSLSLKAKGLLSLMLSLPDDWNFNMRGLSSICKEGLEAIGSALKELEKAGYMVRNQLRGANGRITDTEYIIYERPQEPAPADPDTAGPDTPPPDTTLPYPGNPDVVEPDMAAPSVENHALLNTKKSNTKKTNTQRPNTHSFPPPAPSTPPAAPVAPVEGMKEIFERREDIKAQIEYDLIADPCNQTQLDEFVEIMLEVALSRSPTMKIGRDAEYPTAFVQQRFEQLNSEHIRKVLDGIQENTTRVWNTRAYLLAALFNAPATTDNHYTMLVNHDMSNGG